MAQWNKWLNEQLININTTQSMSPERVSTPHSTRTRPVCFLQGLIGQEVICIHPLHILTRKFIC